MNEEPKSIWKKSWPASRWFRVWLILLAATFLIVFTVFVLTNKVQGWLDMFIVSLFTLGASAIVATVFLCLQIFIRWLCCWRNFKRFLFGLVCFITLIALFYAEEDWRGKHDWEKFKREWEAKGEKFDFKNLVPLPVPDEQNFAMAPVFDAVDKSANQKWRTEHKNPHYGKGGDFMLWDTNIVDRLDMSVVHNYEESPTNGTGNWLMAKASNLKAWQDYYRALAAKTNEFPVAPQPQTPAQDVLLALSRYNPAIEELREASQRPDSRFPLDYDDEDPAVILLPHLAELKRCCLVLQLRAIAELENGQSDKALDDVKLALYLTDSIRTEPFIISQLVRFAGFQITLQPIYEGLAEHKWSDAQLAELDSDLSKLDFLAGYQLSVRGERAAHIKIIDYLEQKRSRYLEFFNMFSGDQQYTLNNFLGMAGFYLMPKGWFYQNELVMAQMHQKWNLPMVDDAGQIISPKMVAQMVAQADEAIGPTNHHSPFNFFARLLLPALDGFAKRTAYTQNSVNSARVAIGLERYRLAHGEYPESLDALTPQFIHKLPHDVINGQPLHYRRASDGQFVLYSVGWNETDDDGKVGLTKGGTVDRDKGDWVWRYPAK